MMVHQKCGLESIIALLEMNRPQDRLNTYIDQFLSVGKRELLDDFLLELFSFGCRRASESRAEGIR